MFIISNSITFKEESLLPLKLSDNAMCFACGRANPIGLKLDFQYFPQGCTVKTSLSELFQGYTGIVHGGIATTILDEVMAHAIIGTGRLAVTAQMEVRFKKPLPTDTEFTVTGQITAEHGRIIETAGQIVLPNGTITTEAKAKFMLAK